MKKFDNKGFMLIEFLVTATLVCTILVFLYTQFYNVKKSYETSFKYNTVNGLYILSNIRDFLIDNDTYILRNHLEIDSHVDLLNEHIIGINDLDYWKVLISSANVKYLIFAEENLENLISNLNDFDDNYESLKKFIRHIDYDKNGTEYRLIAEYNDGTFASILIGDE